MNPIDEIVSERDKARERGDLNANVCFLATVSEDGGGQCARYPSGTSTTEDLGFC